ncbi:hypothetical protein KS606_000461 [Salmonella enterica]|nr:hypothetical protein [Salmonella enterica]EHQ9936738.1 hypothetical protein [Salmonella enterica]ELE5939044.1 hypothetical protein [Salmonella enterica]
MDKIGSANESAARCLPQKQAEKIMRNNATTEGAWTPGKNYSQLWATETPIIVLTTILGPVEGITGVRAGTINNTRDLAMSCTIGFFTAKKNFTKSVGIAAGIAYLGNNGSGVAGASTAAAKAVDLMLGKAYSFIKSPLLSFATGAAGEAVGDKTTNNINDK